MKATIETRKPRALEPGSLEVDDVATLNSRAADRILAARREPDPTRRELRYEEALELLEQAEALEDGNPATCTNEGALFCDMSGGGQKSKPLRRWAARWAHAALARAIHLGSTDANTYLNMAIALTRLGQSEAAKEHFATARELSPDPCTVAALTNLDALEAFRSGCEDGSIPRIRTPNTPRPTGKQAFQKRESQDLHFESHDFVVPRGHDEVIEWVMGFEDEQKPIVALVDRLLLAAQRLEAKAITIEPSDNRFRVGFTTSTAKIREWEFPDPWSFPKDYHLGLVARIMITAGQDVTRRGSPQLSECKLETTLGAVDLAVTTGPSNDGVKIVIQLLS